MKLFCGILLLTLLFITFFNQLDVMRFFKRGIR